MMVKKRWVICIVGLIGTAVFMAIVTPIQAQIDPTATPDAEGIIYDTVRDGDTMWAVAYRNGISLEELLTFNNLSESDFIHPGDLLIVGIVVPQATATPVVLPTVTPTRPPPTPTNTGVPPPATKICLVAFDDNNANGVFDAGESLQTAVAFTIFTAESVIANYITDGISEPYCTDNLTPGEYQVTRSILPGETLTSSGNRTVLIQAGDVVNLQFGGTMATTVIPTQAPITETAVAAPLNPTVITVGEDTSLTTPEANINPAQEANNNASLIALGIVIIGSFFLGGVVIFILRLRNP